MELEVYRLFIDFGTVVLIWMVQLVIYPSFSYYLNENLLKWHKIYTRQITFVVAPLMFAQTGLIATQLLNGLNWYTISSAIICCVLWLLTFFEAVPLHHKIETNNDTKDTITTLVRINWKRTVLWSVLFVLSVVFYYFN